LSGAMAIATAWMVYRREVCAVMVVLMAALGADLAIVNSGFGVFKLAMYAQPYLMTTAALSMCLLLRVAR